MVRRLSIVARWNELKCQRCGFLLCSLQKVQDKCIGIEMEEIMKRIKETVLIADPALRVICQTGRDGETVVHRGLQIAPVVVVDSLHSGHLVGAGPQFRGIRTNGGETVLSA